MAYSPQSLKDIAKPIADGFYMLFLNEDSQKSKPSSVEEKTNLYNSLYKFVYEHVDNYFQKNTFTTKDNLDRQIKDVVNIINSYLNSIIRASADDCTSNCCTTCACGTCCVNASSSDASYWACFCCNP